MGKATSFPIAYLFSEEVSNRKTMAKGLEFVQKLEAPIPLDFSSGSRPPATITWWKRAKFMGKATEEVRNRKTKVKGLEFVQKLVETANFMEKASEELEICS